MSAGSLNETPLPPQAILPEGQKVANRKIELIFLQRFRILRRDRASIGRNTHRRWLDLSRLGTAL
jgi:hypothetical protein